MWTHPRDRSTEYNTIQYRQNLARLVERGKFPAVPHETADMRLRDPQPDQISTARRCSFVASNRG